MSDLFLGIAIGYAAAVFSMTIIFVTLCICAPGIPEELPDEEDSGHV